MPIDHVSLSVTPVWLRSQGRRLVIATGFFLGHGTEGGNSFVSLVTNRHVVLGPGVSEGTRSLGDSLEFELRLSGGDPNKVQPAVYPLYTTTGEPTWLVSSTHPKADVAVVPLPLGGLRFDVPPYCLGLNWVQYDIVPYPGESVSVVGYPLGWRDKVNRLPVWKTGHIASEPDQDFDGQPRFLIDITGRRGMSGSPVLAGHKDLYYSKNGLPKMAGSGALLGVYASNAVRFDDVAPAISEDSAAGPPGGPVEADRPELGFVWKSSLLEEIVLGLDIGQFTDRVLKHLPGVG
jgi:hypothetical protein